MFSQMSAYFDEIFLALLEKWKAAVDKVFGALLTDLPKTKYLAKYLDFAKYLGLC